MLAVLLFLAAGVFGNELEAPGLVAAFCDGSTGHVTYTAPSMYLISDENYFVATGCSTHAVLTADGKNLTLDTDCESGKPSRVLLGADVASVTITASGTCGDARLTADPNDQGAYGTSKCGKKNPVGNIKLVKLMPNIKAQCCSSPHGECGSGTGKAPAGYLINGKKNYFVVTGCYGSGTVVGKGISSQTDCTSGRTPAKLIGDNVDSLSITGGGYCGESRVTRLPNDDGVYSADRGAGSNPGIILTPIGALLEKSHSVTYRPAQFLGTTEGQKKVASLKARLA